MSISLPNNKTDKRARLDMLVKQGSISKTTADKLYADYCRLYNNMISAHFPSGIKVKK